MLSVGLLTSHLYDAFMQPHLITNAAQAALPGSHRNRMWRTYQFALQNVFAFWLTYRAYGLENLPPAGGGLIVANHQSYLDPLLIGLPLHRPISFLARDSLFKVPLLGWILRNTYVMPINRDAASPSSIRECLKRMEEGFLVGIFPEGTRTPDGEMAQFKPGFLSLIRRSDVPVYPVGISGAYEAYPKGAWFVLPKPVRVVYGQPITRHELASFLIKGQEDACIAFIRKRVENCVRRAKSSGF